MRFTSGDSECSGWHYRGENGGCVVMAGGFAVPKEPGTDRFARRFHQHGFSVLAFDYRHLGDSGGEPRQVVRIGEQLEDWDAAVSFAKDLPEVDRERIAVWGFSLSGGHVFSVASHRTDIAAAIAQAPNVDGQLASRNAARHQTRGALLRFACIALLDALSALARRPPRLIPLAGAPGTVAMLTTPDALDAAAALRTEGVHTWRQEVAARSAMRAAFYRPGRHASRVQCPLLVVVSEDDQSALAQPAVAAASKAPQGQLAVVPGGHYATFLASHETAVADELAFLQGHLIEATRGAHAVD